MCEDCLAWLGRGRPGEVAGVMSHAGLLAEPLVGAPRRRRVEVLDNAKAVLVCCVVLYHTAVVYTSADRPEVRALAALGTSCLKAP